MDATWLVTSPRFYVSVSSALVWKRVQSLFTHSGLCLVNEVLRFMTNVTVKEDLHFLSDEPQAPREPWKIICTL